MSGGGRIPNSPEMRRRRRLWRLPPRIAWWLAGFGVSGIHDVEWRPFSGIAMTSWIAIHTDGRISVARGDPAIRELLASVTRRDLVLAVRSENRLSRTEPAQAAACVVVHQLDAARQLADIHTPVPPGRRGLPPRYDKSGLTVWNPDDELVGTVLVRITDWGQVSMEPVSSWAGTSPLLSRCAPGDVVFAVAPDGLPRRIDDPATVLARFRAAQRDR